MKNSGRLALIGAMGLSPFTVPAQTLTGRDRWADSARVLIESAVRRGNSVAIDSARVLLDRATTAFPNDPLLMHYQGYALYRKATLALGKKSDADTGPALEAARDLLDKSGKALPLPETFALQSAVFGQIIARSKNPITGMTLGSKSSDAMTRAIAEGSKNPRVWLLRGIGAMFTPSMWGGGLDKAQDYLEKSVTYFAADNPQRPLPAWGRAEAYIWLGQVYAKQGKADAAKDAYQNAVKNEPDNGWARALLSGNASPVPDK